MTLEHVDFSVPQLPLRSPHPLGRYELRGSGSNHELYDPASERVVLRISDAHEDVEGLARAIIGDEDRSLLRELSNRGGIPNASAAHYVSMLTGEPYRPL